MYNEFEVVHDKFRNNILKLILLYFYSIIIINITYVILY